MNANKSISLVIPAYNEEASIHSFFARVRPIMDATGYDLDAGKCE